MRLWHEKLISKLPRQQLLGQHRECCALRGNGWGKKHATVDYVFTILLIDYSNIISLSWMKWKNVVTAQHQSGKIYVSWQIMRSIFDYLL